jgi:hypothetical protein
MAKISFDKYYTPPTIARWCIDKTKEIIGEENITEWVEPSAGCGMFSHQIIGCKAYDLYPQHEYIEQVDFLELDLGGYKKGRCFIGNPPYGSNIIKKFYNKCCDNGDYIAFILPASYCNNVKSLYRFEIVYSCIIVSNYTNKELKTSFTIYKKNIDKDDFREKEESIDLKDVELIHYSRSHKKENKKIKEYDYSFTSFGRLFKEAKPYEVAGVISVKCNNEYNKTDIINFLKWLYYYNIRTKKFDATASNSISINQIKKLLKICIPEIK